MPNFPMTEFPGHELLNQPSSSVQDQLQQNRVLSGRPAVLSGPMSNNVALLNVLRHIQQLGTEGRPVFMVFYYRYRYTIKFFLYMLLNILQHSLN